MSDLERRKLSREDAARVRTVAHDIATKFAARSISPKLDDPLLIDAINTYCQKLPTSVRKAMSSPATSCGVTVISTLLFADSELGPTPHDWREAMNNTGSLSFELDIALLLLARCAGEPFGWESQQTGRLVNNIVPTQGHEREQSGASSSTLLTPHTEDAFHPQRANLLLLGCLRNPDRIGTTTASVLEVELDNAQLTRLEKSLLPILPDVSYGEFATSKQPAVTTFTVFNGQPFLRYDPAYTPLAKASAEFRRAYDHLESEFERVSRTAVLLPGELLLLDNDAIVHGRVPFAARYDGTDRWLKRVNIHLPTRRRPTAEANGNGYGQRTITPFHGI